MTTQMLPLLGFILVVAGMVTDQDWVVGFGCGWCVTYLADGRTWER